MKSRGGGYRRKWKMERKKIGREVQVEVEKDRRKC